MLTSYLKRSTMLQSRCQAVQPLETRLLHLQSEKGSRVSVFVGPIVPPFFFSDKPLGKDKTVRLAQLHLWDKTAKPVVDLAQEERTVDGPSDETYHSQGLQLGLLLSFADRGPKHSHTENEQCQNGRKPKASPRFS